MAPIHQGPPWCDEREGRATSCASNGTWLNPTECERSTGRPPHALAGAGKWPSLAEEASQLAGGRDLGVWPWWQTGAVPGVHEARSTKPGTAVFQGDEASQLAGGRDGRWAWGQLAPQSGRHRYLRLTLWPGPCGESVKPDPGNRAKVSEPWLEANSPHR